MNKNRTEQKKYFNKLENYDDINEDKYLLLKQEGLYCCSTLLDYSWYRKLFGGKWRLIKFGKDTPAIGMLPTMCCLTAANLT